MSHIPEMSLAATANLIAKAHDRYAGGKGDLLYYNIKNGKFEKSSHTWLIAVAIFVGIYNIKEYYNDIIKTNVENLYHKATTNFTQLVQYSWTREDNEALVTGFNFLISEVTLASNDVIFQGTQELLDSEKAAIQKKRDYIVGKRTEYEKTSEALKVFTDRNIQPSDVNAVMKKVSTLDLNGKEQDDLSLIDNFSDRDLEVLEAIELISHEYDHFNELPWDKQVLFKCIIPIGTIDKMLTNEQIRSFLAAKKSSIEQAKIHSCDLLKLMGCNGSVQLGML